MARDVNREEGGPPADCCKGGVEWMNDTVCVARVECGAPVCTSRQRGGACRSVSMTSDVREKGIPSPRKMPFSSLSLVGRGDHSLSPY